MFSFFPFRGSRCRQLTYGLAVVLMILSFGSSTYAQTETPDEALKTFIEHYKSKDFSGLIYERYAELHKAPSQKAIDSLIARFEDLFEDESKLEEAIDLYTQALSVKPELQQNPYPQISETDLMAVYKLPHTSLILYLLKTGKWGFHL